MGLSMDACKSAEVDSQRGRSVDGRSPFSVRTSWDLTPNPLAIRLEEMRGAGSAIIDLTEPNPTRCGFDYPDERILRAISDPSGLAYDPDPRGLRSAREAVARELSRFRRGREVVALEQSRLAQTPEEHGSGAEARSRSVDPASIVLSSGTSEAYSWLFKLLCEPGDQVLVPAPSYPLLDFLAHLENVELTHYPIRYDGRWHVDLERIGALCAPRTRALVIIQPNNPTGSFLSADELAKLTAILCARGVALISDEVFIDYRFDSAAPAIPSGLDEHDRSREAGLRFVLGGLSKSAGLPQMKLAWIAVAGPSEKKDAALQRLEMIADTFLSVNTPVQVGLSRLLDAGKSVREQILARVRANRRALLGLERSASCWGCLDAQAGWYAVLRLPRLHSDDEWCLHLLERERVHAHPGHYYSFPVDGHIVLSLLPRPEEFLEGITRIVSLVEEEAARGG